MISARASEYKMSDNSGLLYSQLPLIGLGVARAKSALDDWMHKATANVKNEGLNMFWSQTRRVQGRKFTS